MYLFSIELLLHVTVSLLTQRWNVFLHFYLFRSAWTSFTYVCDNVHHRSTIGTQETFLQNSRIFREMVSHYYIYSDVCSNFNYTILCFLLVRVNYISCGWKYGIPLSYHRIITHVETASSSTPLCHSEIMLNLKKKSFLFIDNRTHGYRDNHLSAEG